MKTDSEIQSDVQEELKWEPYIKSSQIGVAVHNGIVTLTGTVDSYSKKISAEDAVMRVLGVRALANDIEVKIWGDFKRNDTEIAEAVVNALKWDTSLDENRFRIKVKDGWVTLEGEVEWEFQKNKVKNLVKDLTGVIGVTNLIKVVSTTPTTQEIKDKIAAALKRNIYYNGGKITVEISENKVTLHGVVRSLQEKYAAANAAWSAPGVTEVDNKLEVKYESIPVF